MIDVTPGQERVKGLFERALREGTLSHAYLLAGPEGLGKTAFARELGVALVTACEGCGACADCERARRGAHPDLHVLEREGELIRIEQIEPVIADLSLKPFAAARRVWVIPEAEALNAPAASKLLKSIEEPPSYVFFLLVTDRPERVMPTIVSRCQVVEFRPLGDEQVARHVREAHALDEGAAAALARLAQGAVERADRLAEDARGPGRRGEYLRHGAAAVGLARSSGEPDPVAAFVGVLERHQQHIRTGAKAALELTVAELEQQFQDRRDLDWHVERAEKRARREEGRARRVAALDAVDVLGSWLRDLWVVACGASEVLWNRDRSDEIAAAAVAAPEHYARLLAEVGRTRKDLYLNIDPKLALFAMFARFEEVAESA